MKRVLLHIVGGVLMASAMVAAQAGSGPAGPAPIVIPRDPVPPMTIPAPTTVDPSKQKSASDTDTGKSTITLTGCIVQQPTTSMYILQNARIGDDAETAGVSVPGKAYTLTSGRSQVKFAENVNHEVTVIASAEDKAPAANASSSVSSDANAASSDPTVLDEKNLPKLTVLSLVSVSDACVR